MRDQPDIVGSLGAPSIALNPALSCQLRIATAPVNKPASASSSVPPSIRNSDKVPASSDTRTAQTWRFSRIPRKTAPRTGSGPNSVASAKTN
ncbi:hypothetical protein TSUKUMMB_14970 [Rhodococcus sp. no. 34]